MSTDASAAEPVLATTKQQTTAVIHGTVPVTELAAFFDRSFGRIGDVLREQDATITGAAFARYHGPVTQEANLEVGFATAEPIEPVGDVVVGSLPEGRVARLVHHGSYDTLGSSWGQLQAWMQQQGFAPGDAMWELYVTEPSPEMDPADLLTELNWLISS
jgi:effector-binding domain-containing protein